MNKTKGQKQNKVNPYAKKPEKKRSWLHIALILCCCLVLGFGLGYGGYQLFGKKAEPVQPAATEVPAATEAPATKQSAVQYCEITVKDYGVITAELYPDLAPITVSNFVKLVNEGFYDGLTFHRIISGFMIQGGDPLGNGMGGSSERIKGEFSANGVYNPLKHTRGVLSMARSSAPDSASSQFFIMHADAPHLDGQYAAFGKVLSGMEVVDAICAKTPVTDRNGTVAKDNQPVITSIRMIEKLDQ
ncbi:MAG: peptidylprolyl isomerase [Clostridia bacterium]|nr:peptidylprolyl isomerase [Clostridia bacterium]